jgi:hypothetical protein
MFESPEWIIVAIGSLLFGGSLLYFGMRLLKRLQQDPTIVNRFSRLSLSFDAFFATLSFCILMVLWFEPLRDSFSALLSVCFLISVLISRRYFHISLNNRLAIMGFLVFLPGILLHVFLLWHYVTALNLDSLPGEYSVSMSCDRVIERIRVTDRVISVNDSTIITAYPSSSYLAQGCESHATLTTSDFETGSPQQTIVATSESSWKGGAWIIRPKKIGIFQLSIDDSNLVYTIGVSVIPSLFGLNVEYDLLKTISMLLLLLGTILVLLSIKQRNDKNHNLDKQ